MACQPLRWPAGWARAYELLMSASNKLFFWLFQRQPDRILQLLDDLPLMRAAIASWRRCSMPWNTGRMACFWHLRLAATCRR